MPSAPTRATTPTTRTAPPAGKSPRRSQAGGQISQPLQIRKLLGLTQENGARLLGVSVRTLSGWEGSSGKPVRTTGPNRRRLEEVNRLQRSLSRILKEDRIGPWLLRANPAFDGRTPLDVIEAGESDRLWRMIHEVGTGNPG
ncbi:helix-turn-helix domain-containing protein [Phycisphaera mikurensis]|nr:helix-turn-helix domain-containing protein [Phycisphaera mikurensis]MBB6442645.1 transcriptional regulator with XRE-family HTH domain [Phycisphaera mikurensis]